MRTKKQYTIVKYEDPTCYMEGLSRDDAMEHLSNNVDGKVLVFEGNPIPHSVSRDPVVSIGAPKTRKPRTVAAKPKNGKQLRKEIETKVGKELDARTVTRAADIIENC